MKNCSKSKAVIG